MKIKVFSLLIIIAAIYGYIVFHAETFMPKEPFDAKISIIREVKPVKIAGYKAFNAGVLALENDGYLFASRKRADSMFGSLWKRFFLKENVKGLVIGELDKDFCEKPNIQTAFCGKRDANGEDIQYIDPRLIRVGKDIYMIYCRQINGVTREASEARLQLAKLKKINGQWKIVSDHRIHFNDENDFQDFYKKGLVQKNFEKNWMPFTENGDLFFIYLMEPEHVILKTELETGMVYIYSKSKNLFPKMFNDARGSTPAVFDEELGEWITLYHFCYPTTRKITGKKKNAYFFAGYTFSKESPYTVLRKSKGPIAGSTIYDNFFKIVFPTALIRDGDDYLVFYGDDDKSNSVARISRDDLINTMQTIGEYND